MIPRATYRIQFNRDFTFAHAERIVPYLHDLGISHIYASPITTAREGSMHGYDVIDPTRVNPELGGEEELRSLVAALRARNMGLVIDIVPNHMGVAGGGNRWWNDVLRNGEASGYARYFDIDWNRKLFLPLLGAPLSETLKAGHIAIDRSGAEPMLALYNEHLLPIRPEDHGDLPPPDDIEALAALVGRQHYRLGWWRLADDELNWRRFFTINELAGLRIEDDDVFEATHALYFRLYAEGLIDGLRIDHVDGLTDPIGYCRKLRSRLDAIEPQGASSDKAWLIVEKILGPEESLPRGWSVDGTSGYDFMEQASALLHDPSGEAALAELWHDFSGREFSFEEEELRARRDMLNWAFDKQLQDCVSAFLELAQTDDATAGYSRAMWRRAVERMIWVFPVYRTYGTGDSAPESDDMVREQVREKAAAFTPPGEAPLVDRILDWLGGKNVGDAVRRAEAVRRFQQLSAPIAAKSVEDTAFYRYGPLLSRNDVGFDAARFSMPVAEFHCWNRDRARDFPRSMLATATHDHKRGEDLRARLAVLSAIPDEWEKRVRKWDALATGDASGVHPADRYMLYQMLFGAWPNGVNTSDAAALERYGTRLAGWQEKALREAKLRSSWEEPDMDYERACRAFLFALLDPDRSTELLGDLDDFLSATEPAAKCNSLVQVALRLTCPGTPDTYQGTELDDFSLVDPDNRRPVDYSARQHLLADGPKPGKLALLHELLQLRRARMELFQDGDYRPLAVEGARADHIVAFARTLEDATLTVAAMLRCGEALYNRSSAVPSAQWWKDTRVTGVDGETIAASALFSESPVSIRLA